MFPSFTLTQRRNSTWANAKFFGESYAAHFRAQNVHCLFFSNFGFVVFRTSFPIFCIFEMLWGFRRRTVPSFSNTILCVVRQCSYKKVFGLCAWRVITFVQYKHPFGNRTHKTFVGKTMCQKNIAAASSHLPITVRQAYPFPIPTSRFVFDNMEVVVAIYRAIARSYRDTLKLFFAEEALLHHVTSPGVS